MSEISKPDTPPALQWKPHWTGVFIEATGENEDVATAWPLAGADLANDMELTELSLPTIGDTTEEAITGSSAWRAFLDQVLEASGRMAIQVETCCGANFNWERRA